MNNVGVNEMKQSCHQIHFCAFYQSWFSSWIYCNISFTCRCPDRAADNAANVFPLHERKAVKLFLHGGTVGFHLPTCTQRNHQCGCPRNEITDASRTLSLWYLKSESKLLLTVCHSVLKPASEVKEVDYLQERVNFTHSRSEMISARIKNMTKWWLLWRSTSQCTLHAKYEQSTW